MVIGKVMVRGIAVMYCTLPEPSVRSRGEYKG